MSDRTAWWLTVALAVANFVVGLWDITTGLTWGAAICFTLGVGAAVCCIRYSNLRRHP